MPTPDFSKVWASNSPLPEYTFSDADYMTGWDFVGAAPPTKNEFDAWFRATDEKLNWLYNQLQNTASQIYPVGSVYISLNSTNPASLFGGTWTRLKDTFLLANGDTFSPNSTGGASSVTLAPGQMPSHTHSISEDGLHLHGATAQNAGQHDHPVTGTNTAAGTHHHTITASTTSSGSHTHTKGTMQIHGTFAGDNSGGAPTGAFSAGSEINYGLDSSYKGIKINFKAEDNWTGSTSSSGSHTHPVTASSADAGSHTHTWSGSVTSAGSHTHTIGLTAAGSHTHTIGNTGGGLPVSIMPPYTTVYMWKRTA